MRQFVDYARQFGHFQRNARLYLISNALSGVSLGIVLLLYNLYLVSLGYQADFVGAVLFVGTIGAGLAIFPAGLCVDRFGGKAILIWSSLLIAVAGAGQFLFRQAIPLLLSAFAVGVVAAAVLVVNAPYLTANSRAEERAHLFSLNLVLTLITSVLGRVLGGALPDWFRGISWLMQPLPPWLNWTLAAQAEPRAYQLALLFAGIISAPSLIPLFMLSDDRPRRVSGVADASIVASDSSRPDIAQAQEKSGAQGALRSLQDTLRRVGDWRRRVEPRSIMRSPVFLLTLVQVLIGLGAGLFIPYFNIFFVQHLGASPWQFGLIDGGATALNALFALGAPWLASRIGKPNSVALTQLLSLPLLISLGLTALLPLAALFYLFRQGLMDMTTGVLQVFSMEAVPQEHRGLANSSYQTAYQVAWSLTTPLGGLLIVHLGYTPLFLIAALFYLMEIAVLWRNFGRGKVASRAGAKRTKRSGA